MTTIIGTDSGDALTGGSGDDQIYGLEGNDTLNGGGGVDVLYGGIGDDVYFVDAATATVVEAAGEGTDTVRVSLSAYTLTDNVENLVFIGSGDFVGVGNGLNNSLTGGSGADTLIGGAGDDTYVLDNVGDVAVEAAGEGTDTVRASFSCVLADNVENLTLTGSAAINGTGNALNNVVVGNGGANTLDGGTGADTLIGGAGSDVYIVDDVGDVVVEAAGQGTDTVRVSLSAYTLTDNVENLVFIGSGDFVGVGNGLNNSLTGGSGADTLIGGAGDDTYVLDNVGDVVVEAAGEGTDTVRASFSYVLADVLENLTLTGSASINGTGNAGDNAITGNGAANVLIGLDGDDSLNGGGGADTLIGGTGNDVYVVDNVGDVVTELAGEGTDAVRSSISYALGDNVENLTLIGSAAINGTGNDLDNVVTGNGAGNTLSGGVGNDTLIGGAGDDVYIMTSASDVGDVIVENAGQGVDEVRTDWAAYTLGANLEKLTYTGSGDFNGVGNGAANVLNGGVGADTLSGGAGDDTLSGGGGADVIDGGSGSDAADYATSGAAVAINLAAGTASGGDAAGDVLISIENLIGSAYNDVLIGDAGSNTLIGGAGADTLTGGAGTDTASYATSVGPVAADLASGTGSVGDAAGDVLNGIENLIGGSGGDALRGDGGSNVLDGGGGDDVLEGRGGDDSLIGGAGTDTAVFSGNVANYLASRSGGTWTFSDLAGADGVDVLTGIEQAQFADRLIYLDGRNNAPIVSGGLATATHEDAVPLSVNLLQGAWDFDVADVLSVTNFAQTGGRTAIVGRNGADFTLDPGQFNDLAVGQSAILTFVYGVTDGAATTTRTLTVTVDGRNDAPSLTAALTATTHEDAGALSLNLLQGATDPDVGAVLSVANFAQTGGRTAIVSRNGANFTLDPGQFNDLAVGESAVLTFAYGVTDGAVVAPQTLNVTVQGRNDAPVANSDQYSVWKNTAKQLTTGMLLANDADPDHGDVLSITSVGNAVNGAVTLDAQGRVVFTPTVGATGSASFKYTVDDGRGGSAEGNVSLLIKDAEGSADNALSISAAGNQFDPTTITLSNGKIAALWWSFNQSDQSYHAKMRRFDENGVLIDANSEIDLGVIQLPFDKYHVPNFDHLRATPHPEGGFVLEYLAQAGSVKRVTLQRFNEDGVKLNSMGGTSNPVPIQVNTDTWNYVVMPRLAILGDGRYMAIWEGHDAANQGDIVGQIFNKNGSISSNQFRINTTAIWHQMYPEVTTLNDGGFVVSWFSGKDATTNSVIAYQRYNSGGQPVGGEAQVGGLQGWQEWPTSTALADGGWVTVWQRAAFGSSDYSIQGQIFNADGSKRGSGFMANQVDAGAQCLPRVSSTADGGFVVSWTSQAAGRDVGQDIWARRYDAQGTAQTSEFRINVSTTGDNTLSSVAPLSDGRFLSFYTGPDASGTGVYWRMFGPGPSSNGMIEGAGGNDVLIGSDASDQLVGYGGNDLLIGGAGADTLTGGLGADVFHFDNPSVGMDVVTDFQPGTDKIEVASAGFGALPIGQLDAGKFALSGAANANTRFIFNPTTQILSYDADGSGSGAAVDLVKLNVSTLSSANIFVVS